MTAINLLGLLVLYSVFVISVELLICKLYDLIINKLGISDNNGHVVIGLLLGTGLIGAILSIWR